MEFQYLQYPEYYRFFLGEVKLNKYIAELSLLKIIANSVFTFLIKGSYDKNIMKIANDKRMVYILTSRRNLRSVSHIQELYSKFSCFVENSNHYFVYCQRTSHVPRENWGLGEFSEKGMENVPFSRRTTVSMCAKLKSSLRIIMNIGRCLSRNNPEKFTLNLTFWIQRSILYFRCLSENTDIVSRTVKARMTSIKHFWWQIDILEEYIILVRNYFDS